MNAGDPRIPELFLSTYEVIGVMVSLSVDSEEGRGVDTSIDMK